jgi:uncharacterized protein (TIGR00156 family)
MLRTSITAGALAALATLAGAAPVAADYQGPRGPEGQLTVAAILKDPKDDTWVVLRGFIVRQTTPERYVFSDGTGEIAIEVERDDDETAFPAQPLDDKTRVEITGEIDKDFRKSPEIDVDAVKIVTD